MSYQATVVGIDKAKEIFKRKGWTHDYLAGACGCTRQTISKFFAKRSINNNTFQTICSELGLKWEEIANWELKEEKSSSTTANTKLESTCKDSQIDTSTVITPSLPQDSITRKAIFILSGTIESVDKAKLKAFEAHLRRIAGDVTLTITSLEEGSIKIKLEGSSQGIEKLVSLFESGGLTELLEFTVENVQVLQTEKEKEEKSRLIEEIRTQGAKEKDLTGADLSSADLRGVDFSGADLFCVDLSNANLSGANLSNVNLTHTNLSGANLNNANLSGTDVIDAKLIGANQNTEPSKYSETYINHPTWGLLYKVCMLDDEQELYTTLYAQRLFFLVAPDVKGLKFQSIGRNEARMLLENRLRNLRRNGEKYNQLQSIFQRTFQ